MEDSTEPNALFAAAGAYHLNTFYFWIKAWADLDPAQEQPFPIAVAIYAHEYVHLLHNASTTAGQAYLLPNLILLKAIAGGCDDQGYFLGVDAMTDTQREALALATALMKSQLGSARAAALCACKNVKAWTFELPELIVGRWNECSVVTTCHAMNTDNEPVSERLEVGLHFISEGVAYEVEREIRRLNGAAEFDLDRNTALFPYQAYGVMVRSWSRRALTARDLIEVGVSALSFPQAGAGLATICATLRECPERPLHAVLQTVRAPELQQSAAVHAGLNEQAGDFAIGSVTQTAIAEYMRQVAAGTLLRQRCWAPELEFLFGPLTAASFWELIGTMLDCLVIQEKPGDTMEMNWIGPGHIAQTGSTQQSLGALQSAIHFSQLHFFKGDIPVPTAELPRNCTCPFIGACPVRIGDGKPEACEKAPWERFMVAPPGTEVCWYAAGVKTLRNQQRRSLPK